MKLKKSLLALTTAATVAVAGSTAAVAEDTDNGVKNSSIESLAGSLKKNEDGTEDGEKQDGTEDGDKNEGGDKEEPSKLATSSANFFGWDADTKGLQKFKDVTALIGLIGTLLGGIITLANHFQKLGKLAK